MKHIYDYILEKANFLVKKHLGPVQYNCVKSIEDLEDECYIKIITEYNNVYLVKYCDNCTVPSYIEDNPLGYYWQVSIYDDELQIREDPSRYVTSKKTIKKFFDLTANDKDIIDYVESVKDKLEKGVKIDIDGKY